MKNEPLHEEGQFFVQNHDTKTLSYNFTSVTCIITRSICDTLIVYENEGLIY